MRQRFFVVEHSTEIAHIKPAAARFAFVKVFGLLNGGPLVSLPMIVPRGIVGVMRAILVILAAARFDRDFGFRAARCPLRGAQDASVRFVGEQLQQPGFSMSGSTRANRQYRTVYPSELCLAITSWNFAGSIAASAFAASARALTKFGMSDIE
jgi:hypothetical protein